MTSYFPAGRQPLLGSNILQESFGWRHRTESSSVFCFLKKPLSHIAPGSGKDDVCFSQVIAGKENRTFMVCILKAPVQFPEQSRAPFHKS